MTKSGLRFVLLRLPIWDGAFIGSRCTRGSVYGSGFCNSLSEWVTLLQLNGETGVALGILSGLETIFNDQPDPLWSFSLQRCCTSRQWAFRLVPLQMAAALGICILLFSHQLSSYISSLNIIGQFNCLWKLTISIHRTTFNLIVCENKQYQFKEPPLIY